MLDIDVDELQLLNKKPFLSYNRFNLFSFNSCDHFGKGDNFQDNITHLLNTFDIKGSFSFRFITLPRIVGFVFNPISMLLVFKDHKLCYLLAEVHNYNGGRVVYPVKLETRNDKQFTGESPKDMYVSPFFKRDGQYHFTVVYDQDQLHMDITLYEENKKVLTSVLKGSLLAFDTCSVWRMFIKHTFLTFWVVLRTLYQVGVLKLKGLTWIHPNANDKIRRF